MTEFKDFENGFRSGEPNLGISECFEENVVKERKLKWTENVEGGYRNADF